MASVSKTVKQNAARWAEVGALFFRSRLANIAGLTFHRKRNLYEGLGYQREIFPPDYRSRYRRNGVANRIVTALPQDTWRGGGEVIEDEDPTTVTGFEEAWRVLEQRLDIWNIFMQADILSRIGRYSIILLGAPGPMDTPLPDSVKPEELQFLTAFPEEDATIQMFDVDVASPRFGLPIYYAVKRTTMVSPDSINAATVGRRVHWTRVIHVTEKLLDDRIFGEPALECIWNYLDDLEKVSGGGAEAFWKRADQGRILNLDPTLDVEAGAEKDLEKQIQEYDHGLRRTLLTRGLDMKPLGSDVSDFQNPVNSLISLICASTGFPQRVLMGSEQGKLAAKMDRSNWDDRVSDRRLTYAGPKVVRAFVQRCIDHKILPTPKEFDTRWADLKVMDDEQKAQVATQWAGLNTAAGATVVLPDEIRERVLGLPPLAEVNQDAADQNDAAFTDENDAPDPEEPGPIVPEAGSKDEPSVTSDATDPKTGDPKGNKMLRSACARSKLNGKLYDLRKLRVMSKERQLHYGYAPLTQRTLRKKPTSFRSAADARTVADRFENKIKAAVSAAFGKGRAELDGIKDRISVGDHAGILTYTNNAITVMQANLVEHLLPLLKQTFDAGGMTASGMVKKLRTAAKSNLKGLTFDATNPRAIDYNRSHGTELISGISKTTREDIKDLVEEALSGDYTVDGLAKEIADIIDDPARAETIARTESMTAANRGTQEGWSQAEDAGLLTGNELQVWITANDDRLCPICEPLDGETAPLDGTFKVDGDDIDGPPAHPNCRCTLGLQAGS